LKEGEVGAGDEFTLFEKNPAGVRVVDITRLFSSEQGNVNLLQRAIAIEALPDSWREYFRKRLKASDQQESKDDLTENDLLEPQH
jgi:MOSC domain-containing protein YiiM